MRVGIGGLPQQTPETGVRSLVGNGSSEGLGSPQENGRLRPWLAEGWSIAPDGLSVILRLRPNAKFHDGSPVTGPLVAQSLLENLPKSMGTSYDDIKQIAATSDREVRIELRRPSQFLIEALETPIQKPGTKDVGTGPYIPSEASGATELRADPTYYLGPPNIDRIALIAYPSVRAAWAELLRGNIDMLYETDIDALDSLQASSDVAVYSYVRHYQYMIIFSTSAPQLQSAEVRRELSAAINRESIVQRALNGHGVPSYGPIPPNHWAIAEKTPRLTFDAALANHLSSRHLRFTCLVPSGPAYERVALTVKQQLAAAGVDMDVRDVTQAEAFQAMKTNRFEAVLGDFVSGPTVFRSYRHWYSKAPSIPQPIDSPAIDEALDRIRHAITDDDYRDGMSAFQTAIIQAPPALFLAWGERARAVSRKFDVVTQEPGRDILINLRLWRPAGMQQVVSKN